MGPGARLTNSIQSRCSMHDTMLKLFFQSMYACMQYYHNVIKFYTPCIHSLQLITSTDDIDLTAPLNRSAIFGAVGGVLTLAIVVVIVVVFVVVMKRKRKRKNKNGGAYSNIILDMCYLITETFHP